MNLQHCIDRFAAACDQAALCLPRNPKQHTLKVSDNSLHQVGKYKYLAVVFTRVTEGGSWRLINGNVIPLELHLSVVTKRELLTTAKLSVFKLFFVPILTYGHESWVMTGKSVFVGSGGRHGIFAKS